MFSSRDIELFRKSIFLHLIEQVTLVWRLAQLFLVDMMFLNYQQIIYLYSFKNQQKNTLGVFLLSLSRRFSLVFWAREGRICKTFMSKGERKYIFELSANYLFWISILFISHSLISLLTRLLNHSNRHRIRIRCPCLSFIKLCRDHQSSNNQLIINI
jgi:hypothetical protein